ncbi:MAG: glycosyltransferase family 4 protein [Desulfobacteraceae bacterium]|nr:glycosyltransferase family 4 protein [Desulfobacteraceae bacterium]
MILKGYPRISETFISNEILLLEAAGFRIHILSMRRPREDFTHASVGGIRAPVNYLPETLLVPLPLLLFYNLRRLLRFPRRYRTALQTAVRRFRRTRKPATVKHLLQAGYLVERFLPGSGIVHFHAHFAHSPASVAMFAGQLSGLPFSFTAHAKDIYTSDVEQLREKALEARFLVTCTEYNRRFLQSLVSPERTPVHRVYHGIDLGLFDGASHPEDPQPPYRILTVARLTRKKGLPTVIRAVKALREAGLPVRYTLIGDGEQREEILAELTRQGFDAKRCWLGTLPHETVLSHYRKAHVFALGCEVAPNGDRDGIPNVLAESMAMGVPVVATHISGIPELLEDGRSGLLVPPRNPGVMARAVARLLLDTHLRSKIVDTARRDVRRSFDNRVHIRRLVSIYRRQVLGSIEEEPLW